MAKRQGRKSFTRHCGKKRQYPTRDDAQWALEQMLDDPDTEQANKLRIYQCEYCEQFHIGRQSKITRS